MNKNVIIGLVTLVIVAIGGILLVSGGDDDDTSSNSASSETSRSSNETAPQVAPADFDNVLGIDTNPLSGNYRVTVTEVEGGTGTTATIEIDDDGNTKTSGTADGQTVNLIYHQGSTYTQDPTSGTWIKFPTGSDSATEATIDIESGITKEDIEELTDADITELGEMPCDSGTCRVYEGADLDGSSGRVYVDTATNLLTKLMITQAGETKTVLEISYEYPDNITIEPPADYQEFQIPTF